MALPKKKNKIVKSAHREDGPKQPKGKIATIIEEQVTDLPRSPEPKKANEGEQQSLEVSAATTLLMPPMGTCKA